MNPTTDEQDDLAAASQFLDTIDAKPFDYAAPEGLDGIGQSLKGLLRPSAAAGRALAVAGAVVPMTQDLAVSALTGERQTALQDSYFRNVVDGLGSDAVEAWTPDPVTMGGTAKALNMVSNVVGSIPQIVGTPSLFLAQSGLDPATELVRQGVDSNTALAVGGVNLAVNAIGMRLPASFGSTLTTRLATGAGSNLALGVAADAASGAVLEDGGYTDAAAGFDASDPYARTLDVLMGLAFGAKANIDAPRFTPEQRDAVLVARNADHLERGSMPGTPAAPGADIKHQTALTSAIDQVLKGERVDVAAAIKPEDFMLRPELRPEAPAPASAGGYAAYRHALESGGRANAVATTSNAVGIDQFIPSTWLTMVGKQKPAWAEGKTREQILAMRTDPAKSAEMVVALDAENTAALAAAGQAPTVHNLYAAHHFGSSKGVRFAQAGGDTPMSQILTQGQLKANPYLQGLTKAQAIANWDKRARRAGVTVEGSKVDASPAGEALRQRLVEEPDNLVAEYAGLRDSEGGALLNADIARELSPEYMADRSGLTDVREAASDVLDTVFERRLAAPTPEGMDRRVLFTAGGTGAGKTTVLAAMGEDRGRPEIVYDANMSSLDSSVQRVEQALAAGREVEIAYVYRDPVESLTGGTRPRAERRARESGNARKVPLEEQATTHTGARSVVEAMAAKYADDPRVKIVAIDNSRGKGRQQATELADLPRVDEGGLRDRLAEAVGGTRDVGIPASGPGVEASQVAAELPTQAAARVAAESPDLPVIDGFDGDGNPRYRPMSEALAEIEAERARAVRDADGIVAAVNCSIRRGS